VQVLTDIARERGHLTVRGLGARISDRHLAHLVSRLLPVLEAWNARSREYPVVEFARTLGRRLRASPELGELLERVLLTTRSAAVASGCLALLREQPDRFAAAAVREGSESASTRS
jgi:hypothetical protein